MALNAVVGYCLAHNTAAQWWLALPTIVVLALLRLSRASDDARPSRPSPKVPAIIQSSSSSTPTFVLHTAELALAVCAAARLTQHPAVRLPVALTPPCLVFFAAPMRLARPLCLLVALVSVVVLFSLSPSAPKQTDYFYARMAFAVHLMLSDDLKEGAPFAPLLVLALLMRLPLPHIAGVLPAFAFQSQPPNMGVLRLAAATALGLCAAKDEAMQLLLLLAHFIAFWLKKNAACATP